MAGRTDGCVARLAPSPTGAQHLGNARTFLLAWLSARSQAGCLVLRIEDIDSPRVKSWAVNQAMDDLRWLGLNWDAGPYVQTRDLAPYGSALERLIAMNAVYPCTCSRTDIESAASAPHVGQEGPVYPGTCSWRSAGDGQRLGERPFAWRLRTENLWQVGTGDSSPRWRYNDRLLGEQSISLAADLGDFVVAKSPFAPAYQLAVVVDDIRMKITEVVRGDDLVPSTFRQLALYQLLGETPPSFVHVPLVVGTDGRRLAKRHGDTRLALLREKGIDPRRIIGRLAQSAGLHPSGEPIAADDLVAAFDWSRVSRERWVLTEDLWRDLLADPHNR